MRSLPETHYTLLKTSSRSLIAAAGGVEGAATLTRVGKSALSDYAHAEKAECFMPIDVALDLTVNTGNLVLLNAIRAITGGPTKCQVSLAATAAILMGETGDVLKSTAAALADHKISPREKRVIAEQIQEAITACVDLLSALTLDGDE